MSVKEWNRNVVSGAHNGSEGKNKRSARGGPAIDVGPWESAFFNPRPRSSV